MYCNGTGVKKDYAEAVKWFRKAAEQGDIKSQLNLAVCYYNGDGLLKDDVMAYFWFNLAATQNSSAAKEKRHELSKKMTKEQIAEAQKLSREWLAKHQK